MHPTSDSIFSVSLYPKFGQSLSSKSHNQSLFATVARHCGYLRKTLKVTVETAVSARRASDSATYKIVLREKDTRPD